MRARRERESLVSKQGDEEVLLEEACRALAFDAEGSVQVIDDGREVLDRLHLVSQSLRNLIWQAYLAPTAEGRSRAAGAVE